LWINRALKAAFDHDLVKARREARRKDPQFAAGSEPGNLDKVKEFVEMLTGVWPDKLSGTQIPWKDHGQDYDSSKGFDDLKYSPTVAFWSNQMLSYLYRTGDKKAYVTQDLREESPDAIGIVFDTMHLDTMHPEWAVRIPFDGSAVMDKPLLTVEPPLYRLDTDEYSALSDTWRDRFYSSTES
jgi:hypothetical protein